MSDPPWITVFLDLPANGYDAAVAFWQEVTGHELSAPRGERAELATLVPPDGDPYLRVQRVDEGPGGIHLDLHHADRAFTVHASPAGLPFCEVDEPLARRPSVPAWPGGHRSVVDQVCIDVPAAPYDEECVFWAAALGRELRSSTVSADFRALPRTVDQPLRILLQRVADDRAVAGAHLDLATDDREAETRRHQALGAAVASVQDRWTVLTDPIGRAYCITDRDPTTGVVGRPD